MAPGGSFRHHRYGAARTLATSLTLQLTLGVGLVAVATGLAACSALTDSSAPSSSDGSGSDGSGDNGARASGPAITERGEGSFVLAEAEPITGHPVTVYYDAPPGDLAAAQVLVVIHGNERDAEDYLEDWQPLVDGQNVLVLVPEFPEDDFSDEEYNLGAVVDSDGDTKPPEEWTFRVVETLFTKVADEVGLQQREYSMFGHSAGAQFVHRYVEFGEHPHLRTAVAANAGWYTVPTDSEGFPYGLEDSPRSEEDMAEAFATDLLVLLGADDNDPDDDSLRHDDGSDEQGQHRLERGLHFYAESREVAEDNDQPFVWRLSVVPGIGHDHTAMASAAAPYLIAGF